MKKIFFTALSLLLVSVIAFGQIRIETPALIGPDDEDENQMPDVILDWDAVVDATSYQVLVSTDENFNDITVDMETPLSGYQNSKLMFNQTYFWKVRAIENEEYSDWSEARSFTTFLALELDKPGDGASGEEAEIEFKWKNKIDGNDLTGVEQYQLQLDTSSTIYEEANPSPMWNLTFDAGAFARTISQVYYGETMYWRLRAMHENDTCEWSEVRSFSTDNQIELNKPNDGTTGAGLSQTIRWKSFDGTVDFEYQVHTVESFNGAITYFVDSTEVPAPQLRYGKTYYWRVLGTNMVDTTEWSEVWTFETSGEVELVSPLNGIDSVALNPLLRWKQITGSNSYHIQYDTDSTFAETEGIYIATNDEVSNPAFNISTGLDDDTKYFWRVRACMKNDTSDFSPAWSFITIPSVGINEYFSNESVALYPNPASGQTTISLFVTRPAVVNYTLTDLTGQEINAGSLNLVSGKNSHTIDLTNFANGIYLFNLTGEGQSFSKKLIIK